jgi:hypothetical protein
VSAALLALGDHGVDSHGRDFLGVAGGGDGRHGDDSAVAQPCHEGGIGRLRETGYFDLLLDDQVDKAFHLGVVGPQVDSESVSGPVFDLPDGGLQLVVGHGGRRDDAEATCRRGGRGQPRPGHPAHSRLHYRIPDAEQVACRRPQRDRRVQVVAGHVDRMTHEP